MNYKFLCGVLLGIFLCVQEGVAISTEGQKAIQFFGKFYWENQNFDHKDLLSSALVLAKEDPALLSFFSHIRGSEKDQSLLYHLFIKSGKSYQDTKVKERKNGNTKETSVMQTFKKRAGRLSIPVSLVQSEWGDNYIFHEKSPAELWQIYNDESIVPEDKFSVALPKTIQRYQYLVNGFDTSENKDAYLESLGCKKPEKRSNQSKAQGKKVQHQNPKTSEQRRIERQQQKQTQTVSSADKSVANKLILYGLPMLTVLALLSYMYRYPDNYFTRGVLRPLWNIVKNSGSFANQWVLQPTLRRLNYLGQYLMRHKAA